MHEIKLEGQVVAFEHEGPMHSNLIYLSARTKLLRDEVEGAGYRVNHMTISIKPTMPYLSTVKVHTTISVHRPPHAGWLEQEIG